VRRFFHYFFLTVGVISIVVGAIGMYARLSGGPIGPIPGGMLRGTYADDFDDATLADVHELALQVNPSSPRSVTTWVVVLDGVAYVPAAFAERKVWPAIAVHDPRVTIRVGDALYDRSATRVEDPELLRRLRAAMAAKYGTGAENGDGADTTWFFQLDPWDR
jgi:hypothetical protein